MSKRKDDGDDENPNLDLVSDKTQKKKPKTLTGYFSATNGKSFILHVECIHNIQRQYDTLIAIVK